MTALFLVALVLAVLILQRRSARQSLLRLEMDHSLSAQTAQVGDKLTLTITFQNRSWGFLPFLRYWEYIPDGLEAQVEGRVKEGAQGRRYLTGTTWLLPKQQLELKAEVTVLRRGYFALSDLMVYGGDFLGLREEAGHFDKLRELVVYPQPAARHGVSQVFGGFLGETSVRRFIQEDPILTLGFLDYTGREPMKSISWTQSARRGELMVKNYDHTLEPTVSVILNVQAWERDPEEDIERCYGLARSVCEELEERRVTYDFRMNAVVAGDAPAPDYLGEGMGPRHFEGIMEQLGRGGYMFRITCETMMEKALAGVSAGRGIVFVTPGDDPRPERMARRLADEKGGTLLVLTAKEGGLC